MTGAEMMQVLQNAEEVLEGFTTKLKVEYDNQDLEGLMQMAQREKLSLSQVPAIIQEQERKVLGYHADTPITIKAEAIHEADSRIH